MSRRAYARTVGSPTTCASANPQHLIRILGGFHPAGPEAEAEAVHGVRLLEAAQQLREHHVAVGVASGVGEHQIGRWLSGVSAARCVLNS